MSQKPSDKGSEFYQKTFHMHPFERGAPYISEFTSCGSVTGKLPSNYPEGSMRPVATTLNIVLTNKEPSHAGVFWISVRCAIITNHLKGDVVEFFTIDPKDGSLKRSELGVDTEDGHTLVYHPGTYSAYRLKDRTKKDGFALLNAVHVPGYVDGDHEHHIVEEMKAKFPQYSEIIEEMGKMEK